MASSRVELISEKIIKPSSPTPSSLKSYKLSFMDQLTMDSYMPMALFYPNHDQHNSSLELLERSLSTLLTSYYPFAGTLPNNVSVDCDDSGVTFIEARINSSMAEILQEPDSSVLDIVFPSELPWSPLNKDNLVVAQLNHFECGGIALGVCMSHKLGDGSTLASFMSDWAAIARQSIEEPSPQFIGASVFPPIDTPIAPMFEIHRTEYVGRRFLLGGKKIAQLKEAVAAESGVSNPTRVEVVTAFLYKCVMAASMANSQSFTPFVFNSTVNLRRLTMPPLAHNSIGNIFSVFTTPIVDEGEMNFSKLVSKLRMSKVEFYEKCKRMTLNEFLVEDIANKEHHKEFDILQGTNVYYCSSMCGIPMQKFDLGSGMPIKVCIGTPPNKNTFFLVDDNNGDGIEAIVTLDEKIMSIFESDEELLAFASPY